MKHYNSIIRIFKNRPLINLILILIFFLFLLTSCRSNNIRSEAEILKQSTSYSMGDKLNYELTQKDFSLRNPISIADYKIGAEDLLDISVFQANELNTMVRVSAMGYIKLPLIGKINATGLTVSELESQISKQLEKYLEEPVVGVFIKEYRSQQITVLGAVNSPKVYSVAGQRHLLDMLSEAGGLTNEAKNICYIQKMSEDEGGDKKQIGTIVIDLNELLLKGRAELNIPLHGGDIIHVPQSDIFFVDGGVESPGSFYMKDKTTIAQAISMAKGLKFEAVRSNILIYRDKGNGKRDTIIVDYDSILDGKSDDIIIKDKDIIIVSESGFKKFLKGSATSVGIPGIFSIGKGF
jgi:polysaccharide export outer membrane protein